MKINEIFYSIQGEGHFSTFPAIFIRFSGCNLRCSFCDTKHDTGYEISEDDIINQIKKYPCSHVVLTGGEPTLQITDSLIERLNENKYFIQIETNGTNPILPGIDWITISPKKKWKIMTGNELKVVYTGQDLSIYEKALFGHYYLQPCDINGEMNIQETVEKIMEVNKWKLSVQLQKLLKVK